MTRATWTTPLCAAEGQDRERGGGRGATGQQGRRLHAGPPTAKDCGEHTSYAAPVYVNGRGCCVTWGGTIGGTLGTASVGDSGHCS